jgi:gliding motility-associated-like protein
MKKLLFLLTLFPSLLFSQGTWTQKADLPGAKRFGAVSFSIGNKGYLGTGAANNSGFYYQDFWEWDQTTDTWTQKANVPDSARCYGVAFTIANKGYVGSGWDWNNSIYTSKFWEYDPVLNTWMQKATMPGAAREGCSVFSIGYKAYIGLGQSYPIFHNDLWEYDALTNSFTQKANFPIVGRAYAAGFSIGNKGYIAAGSTAQFIGLNDLWEYDPATNSWTQKANLPSTSRDDAVGFSIGNYGYVGMGDSISFKNNQLKLLPLSDFWQYNPYINSWTKMADYGGGIVSRASSYVIGCRGYAGTGWSGPVEFTGVRNDLWEFTPPVPSAVVAGINTICAGDSTSLFAGGGLFYQWSTGQTTKVVNVKPAITTTYFVIVSDACGADTAAITVNVIQYPVVSVQYDPNLCGSGVVQFTDSSTNANTWYWDFGDGHTSTVQDPANIYATAGQYIVTLTVSPSPFGCATTLQVPVDLPAFSELYIPTAFSPNGDGYNDVYYVFGSCITEMTFTIFDRWGEKVFETSEPAIGWDGKYKGQLENAGVFMYSFDGTLTTGEKITKKGNITLMR